MKFSCFAFYGEHIIRITPDGDLDLDASIMMLRKLASESAVDDCGILLDLRWVQCRMTLDQMYVLAITLGSIDPPYNERIAILYDLSQCEQKVRPELKAPATGFTVAHFDDFEEAFRLMASGECGKVVLFLDPADADGLLIEP